MYNRIQHNHSGTSIPILFYCTWVILRKYGILSKYSLHMIILLICGDVHTHNYFSVHLWSEMSNPMLTNIVAREQSASNITLH